MPVWSAGSSDSELLELQSMWFISCSVTNLTTIRQTWQLPGQQNPCDCDESKQRTEFCSLWIIQYFLAVPLQKGERKMIYVNLRRLCVCVCYILSLKTFSTFAEEFPNCVTHGTGVHRPSEWSVVRCASKFGPYSINDVHKKSLLAGHLKKRISFNLHAASMPQNDSAFN